ISLQGAKPQAAKTPRQTRHDTASLHRHAKDPQQVWAMSGHAAATPLSRVMNSRRLMRSAPQAGGEHYHTVAKTLLCITAKWAADGRNRSWAAAWRMPAHSPLTLQDSP